MIGYKRNFDNQQVNELNQQIEHFHDVFFEADNPDEKAEALRLMRNYAAQYLYHVPHAQKFVFPETGHVLARSVAAPVFEPRDASEAFENLAKYAHNLYEQPWRIEFRKIMLISGFYIHQISAHLSHAQELLVKLKYAATDDTTLVLTSSPDLKILKAFSRDCFIASQECLILSQVWERVQLKVPDYPMTVQDAFHVREKLVGDVDTVAKSVIYRAQNYLHEQREKQEQFERRQLEAQRLKEVEHERIRRQREQLELQERQRREIQEKEQENRRIETKHDKEMRKRAELQEMSRNAAINLQTHKLNLAVRHVPIDRLIDFQDDDKDEPESDESELVRHVKINTEKFGSAGTEYSSQFSERAKKGTIAPTRSILNEVPELQDVAMQYHLNQNKSSHLDRHEQEQENDEVANMEVDPINRSLEENIRNFEEKSSRVEQFKNRHTQRFSQPQNRQNADEYDEEKEFGSDHSAFTPYGGKLPTSLQNGSIKNTSMLAKISGADSVDTNRIQTRLGTRRENEGSSSGFKNLKQKQDLPKTSSSSSSDSSFKSLRSKSSGTATSDAAAERDSQSSHLTKSRVSQAKVPDFDEVQPGTGSSSELELARDILDTSCYYSTRELCELVNLNHDSQGKNKNVSDKDLKLAGGLKKSEYWPCPHCTYVNKKCPNICEICSKSKDLELSDSSEYSVGEKSYATATAVGASKNPKLTNLSPEPQLGLQKDPNDYPPLDSTKRLSVEKFRNGFGLNKDTDDENSNGGSEDWECSQCTLKNRRWRSKCEACDNRRCSPDLR